VVVVVVVRKDTHCEAVFINFDVRSCLVFCHYSLSLTTVPSGVWHYHLYCLNEEY